MATEDKIALPRQVTSNELRGRELHPDSDSQLATMQRDNLKHIDRRR